METSTPSTVIPERMFKVYKNTMLSCSYIFKNGKSAVFIDGKYLTDNLKEQAELEEEIALGHPYLYIDAKESQVSAKDIIDPMHKLRAKMREEILKEIAENTARACDPNRDMGTTDQEKLSPGSTTTIAPVAAGAGPGTVSSASLTALLATKKS